MRKTSALFVLGALVALLGAPVHANDAIPASVIYQGNVVDEAGNPLQGKHDLELRFLHKEGVLELYVETHRDIEVREGRFALELGTGERLDRGAFGTLKEAFVANADVYLEVSIDGRVQNPWVEIAPAGHSAATRAALSGPVGVDDGMHTKGWDIKSASTGIQAVILGPADDNAAGPVAMDSQHYSNPMLVEMTYLGESIAVRDLEPIDTSRIPVVEPRETVRPRHEDIFDEDGKRYGTTTPIVTDSAVSMSAPVGAAPPTILNFDGMNNINGVYPPDTEGTVGPNHYIQAVNLSFSIYDKMGALLQGPFNTNTLWSGFGGPCETTNDGDPIFVYDESADRFVLSQFALFNNLVCFAVSTTPDPTGSYYLYSVSTVRFPDYFKVGVWPVAENDMYMMTTNTGFSAQYDIYALDRASMLAGVTPEPAQRFFNFPNLLMPADVDGSTPPPAGTPGLMYTFRDGGESYFIPPSPVDTLDLYELNVDWAIPANSTFLNNQSITPAQGLADFNWTVCGFFESDCLPQPNTAVGIDSASWWPMQRYVYRNFGTHETLLGSWTVDVTGTPDLAGVRWFELRRPISTAGPEGADWTIHQQGTHSPDSTHRFMPSIGMDDAGNIALGYSVTSGSVFPSIRYAVRGKNDPLGTLQSEGEMMTGTGSQTGPANRWGDYSSMELDPADGCTFWYTNEYLLTTGGAPWRTRVATFQIPGCLSAVFDDGFESGTTSEWDSTVP